MVSISSARYIRERARKFSASVEDWSLDNINISCKKLEKYITDEYDLIPEKERKGKGIVFITKHAAKEIFLFLKRDAGVNDDYFLKFAEEILERTETKEKVILLTVTLFLLSELVNYKPERLAEISHIIEKYASHPQWTIREIAIFPILSGLKKKPNKTLEILSFWAISENENLRRLVPESLRPKANIKWLRDPRKNDRVLEILTLLRKDPSIYVRKSVGNNIKDLTKYMPEKMLYLMQHWIQDQNIETGIRIHDELSLEKGLSMDEKCLIWTMKHAMRWIKQRNPEHHPALEQILGKNYVLYFDEKKNRLAKKPQ